ncbi:11755_t:CDS:2 [Rhizophagus irregularis]|nr:11755_t:CDS:2 [Rhizophagus irregularis]
MIVRLLDILQKLIGLHLEKLLDTEDILMKAVSDSLQTYEVGLELLIKKENDFIDDTGELNEINKTLKWRNTTTSRARGLRTEQEQYKGTPENFASSSRRQ